MGKKQGCLRADSDNPVYEKSGSAYSILIAGVSDGATQRGNFEREISISEAGDRDVRKSK